MQGLSSSAYKNISVIIATLILPKSKIPLFLPSAGFVAQLNRASDYGSEGYRFESYRGH